MKSEKHDRRSERSRRLLGAALIALMAERPYADLTVGDILARADVGRSTFYAHYFDKDDLLASEIARMLDALTEQAALAPGSGMPALPPSLGLLQHIASHERLYQALRRGGGLGVALRALRERLCGEIERRLAAQAVPALEAAVGAQAVVGALLALIQWWLEEDLPLTAARLNDHYLRLVAPGAAALAGSAP